jgi:hypothetical protein
VCQPTRSGDWAYHLRMTRRFIGYPVDRLLAVIDDPAAAASAAADLAAAGIPTSDISLLRGDEGADRLDGTGAANGRSARLRRLVDFTVADQLVDMAWYEQAVREGRVVLMIRARGDARKRAALEVLRRHDAHFINFYGRFATEEIARWRGPEPAVQSLLKR